MTNADRWLLALGYFGDLLGGDDWSSVDPSVLAGWIRGWNDVEDRPFTPAETRAQVEALVHEQGLDPREL